MTMYDFDGLKTKVTQFFSLNVTRETCSETWLRTGKILVREHFEILGSKHNLI